MIPNVVPTYYRPLWQNTIYVHVTTAVGNPIGNALVHIEGPQGTHEERTPSSGYWWGTVFYNVSSPGTYNIWAEAAGYQRSTTKGVYVDENTQQPPYIDVALKEGTNPPPPPKQSSIPLIIGLGLAGAVVYKIAGRRR